MAANALIYFVLIFAHILNNDFYKEVYVEPAIIDDTKRPYYLWATAVAMYEFALPVSLAVMIIFTFLEFPYMVVSGLFDLTPWYFAPFALLVHIIP